jgi:hypothetical protein
MSVKLILSTAFAYFVRILCFPDFHSDQTVVVLNRLFRLHGLFFCFDDEITPRN